MHLTKGNSKLGNSIYHFSIPEGKTCPGRTNLCSLHCYIKRGPSQYPSTQNKYARNHEASLKKNFDKVLAKEVQEVDAKVVRIHSSGDFYGPAYIRKWISIANQCPQTTFYGYTRSWRKSKMEQPLQEFAKLPNVHLWLSTDNEAGEPPKWEQTRVAHMQTDYDEPITESANLVFRVKRYRIKKYVEGRLVCPVEQGIQTLTGKKHVQCDKCRLCFQDRPIPTKSELPIIG